VGENKGFQCLERGVGCWTSGHRRASLVFSEMHAVLCLSSRHLCSTRSRFRSGGAIPAPRRVLLLAVRTAHH